MSLVIMRTVNINLFLFLNRMPCAPRGSPSGCSRMKQAVVASSTAVHQQAGPLLSCSPVHPGIQAEGSFTAFLAAGERLIVLIVLLAVYSAQT